MSFEPIRYQQAALRALRAAVARDRLPQALLFTGPRGVGKGMAARALAQLLFCETPRETELGPDACGTCGPCRRVARGTHPDLAWFAKEPERNDFRIQLVARRDGSPDVVVNESITLSPMEADRTVTVLDDAERLNAEAANALLKSLEEPAPHAVLILLCADAGRLPATIRSRCQTVLFRPLPAEFVAELVRGRPEAEGASAEEIAFVSRFAGGSVEQAARLVGSGFWALKREIVGRLASLDPAAALALAEDVAAWAKERVKAGKAKTGTPEETALRRESARLALAAAASALRDAAVIAGGAEEAVPLVNPGERPTLERLALRGREALVRAMEPLADGQAHILRYAHVELATENALVQAGRRLAAG